MIVRTTADGTGPVPITPSYEQGRPRNFNVRTAAHSYGGGAWTVASGVLYFSNYSDGRLYRQEGVSSLPRPITAARSPTASPSSQRNYADGVIDRIRNRWIGICEDRGNSKNRFPDNKIIAVDLVSRESGQLQFWQRDTIFTHRQNYRRMGASSLGSRGTFPICHGLEVPCTRLRSQKMGFFKLQGLSQEGWRNGSSNPSGLRTVRVYTLSLIRPSGGTYMFITLIQGLHVQLRLGPQNSAMRNGSSACRHTPSRQAIN